MSWNLRKQPLVHLQTLYTGLETIRDPIQTVLEANFRQCCGINTLETVFMGRNNKEEPKRFEQKRI